ncbi:MAG: DUF2807 domain-containing protein [Bacteroidetes bacterium]|nr:MAG: DUF2807 domain-containing protein [Bacteroidota bacterium]TAE69086.1 MAG: DUF2807 domain-containing protein [Bacteroidota bacterium]TAF92023.1 MAG: DUF2807 domain-containing protein [Bacteroidota bacterium]
MGVRTTLKQMNMKVLFTALIAACTVNAVSAQRTQSIAAFNELNLKGSANVTIQYGTKNEAVITGESENQKIVFEQKGNKLSIGTDYVKTKSWSYDAIKVVLYTTELNNIALSGSGNVVAEGAFTNSGTVNISISGSGNVTTSVGNSQDLNILMSGSGNVTIKTNGDATSCSNLNLMLSGSGNIDAVNVIASEANVKISGSGNASVHATKTINAIVSGSGNVRYKGSPANINEKSSHKNALRKID